MNILNLTIKNYRSYEEAKISFDEPMYIILGKIGDTEKSNGAGKSSIVKAICDTLYGTAIESDIREGQKVAELELVFELENKSHTIKRVLERGKTQEVYVDGKKQGVKASQDIINAMLGAPHDIFKNTSYFRQGDLDSFSKLTPKEAKDVVIKILQLGIYSEYEKTTKERISKLKGNILETKTRIDTTKELIHQEEEAQEESKYSSRDLKIVEEALEDLKLMERMERFLEDSQNKIVKSIEDSKEQIKSNLQKTKYSLDDKESRIKKLKSLSNEAFCPTCEHTLNKDDINKIVDSLTKELTPLKKKEKSYLSKIEKIDKAKDEISSIDISVQKNKDKHELVELIAKIKEDLKRQAKDKKKIEKLKGDLKKLKASLDTQQTSMERHVALQTAFGRNGIQAYVIENVIPEIQMTANDILSGLDTPIRLSIDSQKTLKKGGKAETLDINVVTEHGERPYANYSGGERTFIDFALRMALAIILARRSNCQMQTLVLDEVFGELDSVNKQIISKALKYVANKFNFKKIIIISHAEELQESCDNVIRVSSDGRTSTVTMEGKYAIT